MPVNSIIPSHQPTAERGWICPVCGRGLAPSTPFCPCYKSTEEMSNRIEPRPPSLFDFVSYNEEDLRKLKELTEGNAMEINTH